MGSIVLHLASALFCVSVFHVDFDNFYERRQYLASMLLPEDPLDGR